MIEVREVSAGAGHDWTCDYCGSFDALLASPIEDAGVYTVLACWPCLALQIFEARTFAEDFEDWP